MQDLHNKKPIQHQFFSVKSDDIINGVSQKIAQLMIKHISSETTEQYQMYVRGPSLHYEERAKNLVLARAKAVDDASLGLSGDPFVRGRRQHGNLIL